MAMRPNKTRDHPGRTYRFYEGETVFDFGDGLSYTDFSYTVQNGDQHQLSLLDLNRQIDETRYRPHLAEMVLSVDVQVSNDGLSPGATVVMAFIKPPTAGSGDTGAPQRSLRRYEKVFLGRGEKKVVSLAFTAHD